MGIRLKEGVNLEKLRKFGFLPGKEWADRGERCLEGVGYAYQHNWWHKFKMEEDNPNKIEYADDEYDQPSVSMCFRVGNGNDLYIDCTPSCTYHIGGSDLDIVSETIYELTLAGLVEKY